jgi:hypothetical protein
VTDDDDLRELLTDAVADVEPAYRLDTIKARTTRPPKRRGWYAVGGAVLAAAAVVTAVSVVSDDNRPRREGPAAGPDHAVALYFVGDTPQGPRLFREFQRLSGGPVAALEAITRAHGPQDPDYRTAWPAGSFESVTVTEDVIEVELGPTATRAGVPALLDVQQVVYTVQAATDELLPVHLSGDGRLHQRAPQNEILALVSISDPAEGLRVGDSFVARGRANSVEANVPWEIRQGDAVVREGFATAEGWMDRLYPWEIEIRVSDLEPGRYTFVAMTDDPSGGTEGFGAFTDTRTIIVD